MSSIISVKDLGYSYSSNTVLQNINFEIQAGEYIALSGPNGGGKTTLIKIILGLIPVNKLTKVNIFGKNPQDFRDWHKIGYVPQSLASTGLDFPITVSELIGNNFQTNSQTKINTAVNIALETVSLLHQKDKLVSHLSGGQRQRAFIARSLVNQPELLILDEPIAGIDAGSQSQFYNLIGNLNQLMGLTIIFVTHDLGALNRWANRIFCVNQTLVIERPDPSQKHGHQH